MPIPTTSYPAIRYRPALRRSIFGLIRDIIAEPTFRVADYRLRFGDIVIAKCAEPVAETVVIEKRVLAFLPICRVSEHAHHGAGGIFLMLAVIALLLQPAA